MKILPGMDCSPTVISYSNLLLVLIYSRRKMYKSDFLLYCHIRPVVKCVQGHYEEK